MQWAGVMLLGCRQGDQAKNGSKWKQTENNWHRYFPSYINTTTWPKILVTLIMTNVVLSSRISFLFFLPPFRLYPGPDFSLNLKINKHHRNSRGRKKYRSHFIRTLDYEWYIWWSLLHCSHQQSNCPVACLWSVIKWLYQEPQWVPEYSLHLLLFKNNILSFRMPLGCSGNFAWPWIYSFVPELRAQTMWYFHQGTKEI